MNKHYNSTTVSHRFTTTFKETELLKLANYKVSDFAFFKKFIDDQPVSFS